MTTVDSSATFRPRRPNEIFEPALEIRQQIARLADEYWRLANYFGLYCSTSYATRKYMRTILHILGFESQRELRAEAQAAARYVGDGLEHALGGHVNCHRREWIALHQRDWLEAYWYDEELGDALLEAAWHHEDSAACEALVTLQAFLGLRLDRDRVCAVLAQGPLHESIAFALADCWPDETLEAIERVPDNLRDAVLALIAHRPPYTARACRLIRDQRYLWWLLRATHPRAWVSDEVRQALADELGVPAVVDATYRQMPRRPYGWGQDVFRWTNP